jgi:hypothetical protein
MRPLSIPSAPGPAAEITVGTIVKQGHEFGTNWVFDADAEGGWGDLSALDVNHPCLPRRSLHSHLLLPPTLRRKFIES